MISTWPCMYRSMVYRHMFPMERIESEMIVPRRRGCCVRQRFFPPNRVSVCLRTKQSEEGDCTFVDANKC